VSSVGPSVYVVHLVLWSNESIQLVSQSDQSMKLCHIQELTCCSPYPKSGDTSQNYNYY